MDKLNEIKRNYQHFVAKNPLLVGHAESCIRIISLFIRGNQSHFKVLLSELCSSTSALLTLLNDSILRQNYNLPLRLKCPSSKICLYLTIIEYIQVLIELFMQYSFGSGLKWTLVVLLQFIKTILKLILLFNYNVGLLGVPPLQPLNRKQDIPKSDSTETVSKVIVLERSKRAMRSLDGTPSLENRSFNLSDFGEITNGTELQGKAKFGEALYISRNFIHLLSLSHFGNDSWKPWIITSLMDISHLLMLGDKKNYTKQEQNEIKRRYLMLLLYMFRSPFYDAITKRQLFILLKSMRSNIPGSGLIITPLMEFLPIWQRLYSYVWSN